MIEEGSVIRGICELRMVRTRWSESSFDRIECDLGSRSLIDLSKVAPAYTRTVPFRVKRLHRQFQQSSQNQECIFDEKIIQSQLMVRFRICGVEVEIVC